MLGIQYASVPPLPGQLAGATFGDYLLCTHSGAARLDVERFIRQSFARSHGADVRYFLPRLLSLHREDEDASLLAAFGTRPAESGRLFLESYLDRPIETVLSDRLGKTIPRGQVVEVGNLAARPGSTRLMIAALTALLHGEGFRWVVFTGAPRLHNSFLRMGLEPLILGPAGKERLPAADREGWGSYYDQSPRVFAGDIRHGLRFLLGNPSSRALLQRVSFSGEWA